jgi:hypothetical protein
MRVTLNGRLPFPDYASLSRWLSEELATFARQVLRARTIRCVVRAPSGWAHRRWREHHHLDRGVADGSRERFAMLIAETVVLNAAPPTKCADETPL